MNSSQKNLSNLIINENFVLDTIRQLKSGKKCYVFKEHQANHIKNIFEENTGIKIFIEKEEDYFVLIPEVKFYKKGTHY